MTLVQLKYLVTIANCGSLHIAAKELFVSQPSLSKAIAALEAEMGIVIFSRSNKGIELTTEGLRFLSYARAVLEQADLLQQAYSKDHKVKRIFAVSAQHYAFAVNAFISLIKEYNQDEYEFSLREERTSEILENVSNYRSDLGLIYFSNFNEEILLNMLAKHNLNHEHLCDAVPHVFVSKTHPLAGNAFLTFEQLEQYPRFYYDQGLNNSFYFAEELHAERFVKKNVVVTDRATLFNLLIGLNGYNIATGIFSTELNTDKIMSIPLKSDEIMRLVYVYPKHRPLTALSKRYITLLGDAIRDLT